MGNVFSRLDYSYSQEKNEVTGSQSSNNRLVDNNGNDNGKMKMITTQASKEELQMTIPK